MKIGPIRILITFLLLVSAVTMLTMGGKTCFADEVTSSRATITFQIEKKAAIPFAKPDNDDFGLAVQSDVSKQNTQLPMAGEQLTAENILLGFGIVFIVLLIRKKKLN